ncbi:hybrid sensor histidine kinase/response regulator [Chenggangzhangella methanolivorans]|uniref:histidine kinase n=1 Tax=Chenggangzhangella methanolivorans TaxID=1437009 RepID=A0A9E6R9V2_9HYPH|nr:ATP-binding protein [Chenggangzhangella methanolivorans]QZO00794.1 response regulator [Chenggangzhangella methanolivorans]
MRLINDILDIEKIQAGRMTFELRSVSVIDLVGQAIGGLKAYADEYEVEVELAPGGAGLMVYGDHDRLTQVVTNLLSNAIKFSPRGGIVTVVVSALGEAVSVVVKDRGPGIPESFRPRLFTKFAQADGSDSRRKGGTGLGLAICREIVERHAGALSYRTAIGEGTEFEVQLPRHVTRGRAAAPAFAELPPKAKVLVCEDDALIAAILAEQMRDAGYEALTAGTVRAALQAVEQEEIVAVLVDLNLPDGDGISLIRDLRATEKGRELPVFVISADADRARSDVRANGLDVAAWMRKPVDTSRLAKLLLQRVGPQTNRPRILHVEDDADLCNVVAAALAPYADVTAVASVAAARREVETGGYEIAILDVALEDGSGLDLLSTFEEAYPRPLRAIIFSARDADRAVAARAEAAMTKSRSSLATLVETVRGMLAERDAEQAQRWAGRRSAG